MKYDFTYSSYIVNLIRDIEKTLAKIPENPTNKTLEIQIRKTNQLKTVIGSCKIEGNTLTLKDGLSLVQGKELQASSKEILEIKNTLLLYQTLEKYGFEKKNDLLKAHYTLMNGLLKTCGKIRKVNVGIGGGGGVKYIAPHFEEVDDHLSELFTLIKNEEYDPLVTSALIHLYIESIHPFEDGNGRIGRFFQTLYLTKKVSFLFQYLNLEGIISENTASYYEALNKSQTQKNANYFVEYSLKSILKSLKDYTAQKDSQSSSSSRLLEAKKTLKTKTFSRLDYINALGGIAPATASRDIAYGVKEKILEKKGSKNQTSYKYRS